MSFQEYPKVMKHPAETPAIVSQWDERLNRHVPEHGQAAKFQPVTVNTRDQEEYYAAQGYRAAGGDDPMGFESAKANAIPHGYAFKEYPKWIGDQLVHTAEQEAQITGEPQAKPEPAAAKPKRASYRERTQAAPADTAAA